MGQETGKPLAKEDSVQELLDIMVQFREKGLFDSLMEAVNHVQDMERMVAKMEEQIKSMNNELAEVKTQNQHLVRKADETVMDRLAERVTEAGKKAAYVKMKISDFKEKIREKCRQIVSGVKAQGKRALNGMVGFLHLREGVERLRGITEKMAGGLDALSESVEKQKEISLWQRERNHSGPEQEEKSVRGGQKMPDGKTEMVAGNAQDGYMTDLRDFAGQMVAEGKSYGSGADAFDAFMAYHEGKGAKVQSGNAGKSATQQAFVPAAGAAR